MMTPLKPFKYTTWMFLCALLLTGCANEAENGVNEAFPEAEPEEESSGVPLGNEEDFGTFLADEGFIEENSKTLVISTVSFDLQTDENIVDGFNLDGVNSDETDEASCGHADQVSSTGEEGIDNKVASIFWIFKDLYGPQINDLLSNAIQEGRLLIVIELLEIDDPLNDDEVTLRWFRGDATPQIGFSGQLLGSQTFYVDESMDTSVVEGARIKDGILEAGPFDYGVPLEIFDADTVIQIRDGILRIDLTGDGEIHSGMMGGAVEVFPLLEELYQTGASSEAKAVAPFIEQEVDSLREGDKCMGMSMAASIEVVEGYLVHYP